MPKILKDNCERNEKCHLPDVYQNLKISPTRSDVKRLKGVCHNIFIDVYD